MAVAGHDGDTPISAVFENVFDFAHVSPPPEGSGGGSGLSSSFGDQALWADFGPDTGG